MKHQTKKDKMDESLGERMGKESSKKQSLKSRRHESEGASNPDHHHKALKHHLAALHKMAKHSQKAKRKK